MASPVDPSRLYLDKLEDTGLALFATSIACGVASVIVVFLRTWVRSVEGVFGTDDALMLGGLALYMVDVALACVGAWHGLGARNENLNTTMMVEGTKYLMIWMLVYVCAMLPVKGSICMTMYRIASTNTGYRIAILVLLAVIVANFFTVFIGILLLCQPVEANWNKALVAAKCASMDSMIGLSYTSTAVSIATDMACAVLPGVILWNTQMALKSKISVSIILSFGSLACISTIVRTPYIAHYRNPTDNLLYYTGNICLWSNVETAIGLVAGSLPSLRRLIMTKVGRSQGGSGHAGGGAGSAGAEAPLGLVTFGGSTPLPGAGNRRRGTFRNPTDGGVSVAAVHARGDGDWRRLKDDGSSASSGPDDKDDGHASVPFGGIRADYSYDVDISRSPDVADSVFRP